MILRYFVMLAMLLVSPGLRAQPGPAPFERAVALADWQLARMSTPQADPRGWEHAVFWVGMTALADAGAPPRIRDAVMSFGRAHRWQVGGAPYFADDHAIAQSYLWAASHGTGISARDPARSVFDRVVDRPARTTLAFYVLPAITQPNA